MNIKKFACNQCGDVVDIIRQCLCLYCNKCQQKEAKEYFKINNQQCNKERKQHLKTLHQFQEGEKKEDIFFQLFKQQYKKEQTLSKKKMQLQRIINDIKSQVQEEQENNKYYKQEELLIKVLRSLAQTNQIQQKDIKIKFLINRYSFFLNDIFTSEPSYQTKSIVQFKSNRVIAYQNKNNFLKKRKLEQKKVNFFRSKSLNNYSNNV